MAIRPAWWDARNPREKKLLIAAAALLALVLAWLLVVRPLMDAQATANARLDAAVTDLAQARAQAAALKMQADSQAAGQPVSLPIAPFLTQSASERGFTNAGVTPSAPDRAAVTIPQASAPVLFTWVAELETRGLTVESLVVRASADRTVSADLILRAGGR